MKTVLINGSPRKVGYTSKMIEEFKLGVVGEIFEINCYEKNNIAPCLDCRYCWKEAKCAINDYMQEIYKKIDEADVLVFATPMYFHSVTGKMKILIDRFQLYWSNNVREVKEVYKEKTSVILMCGGAPVFKNQFLGGELILKNLSKELNAKCKGVVTISDTDKISDSELEVVKEQIKEITTDIYK